MLSSMNLSNKPRSRKWEKTQKPKIRHMFYHVFSQFYQKSNMILWSIRTFWYKGSAENKNKKMFAEKGISLKNSSLKLKAWFRRKVNKSINLTFYKWVHNVIPVTNPTQYTKLGKYTVKTNNPNLPQIHQIIKKRVWSYGRYAYSGIRVRPKTRTKKKAQRKVYLSKTAA